MDFRILNDHPLSLSVSRSLLQTERLDIDFYLPERVEAEEKVTQGQSKTACLEELRLKSRPITDGIRRHDKSDEGVRLIRTQNLSGPTVSYNDVAYIGDDWHNTSLKSEVRAGDLLIAIRGYLGNAAIVGNDAPRANINQHIARVSLDSNKCSVPYLWAFICSRFGRCILERYVTGTVQRGITLPDLRRIRVPLPERHLQDYIGAKVQLAVLCRAEATAQFALAEGKFDNAVKFSALKRVLDLKGKGNWVEPELLKYNLFAGAYLPKYIQLDHHIQQLDVTFVELSSICDPIAYGYMPVEDYAIEGKGVPFIRVTNISNDLMMDISDLKFIPSEPDYSYYQVNKGDALLVQCGNTTGKIGVVTKRTEGFVYPSFSFRIRSKGEIDQYYLAFALKSELVQMLLWRTVKYSTVRPNTTKPDVEKLLIPLLPREVMEDIGIAVKRYVNLMETSLDLIQQAKADVEALIEGTLDTDAILTGKVKPPTWEAITAAVDREE